MRVGVDTAVLFTDYEVPALRSLIGPTRFPKVS